MMTRHNERPFTTSPLFALLKRVLPEHLLLTLFGRRVLIPVECRRSLRSR
jgi:hypothetical protein